MARFGLTFIVGGGGIGVPSDLGEWRGDRESHSVFSIEITKQRLEKILEENIKLVM